MSTYEIRKDLRMIENLMSAIEGIPWGEVTAEDDDEYTRLGDRHEELHDELAGLESSAKSVVS